MRSPTTQLKRIKTYAEAKAFVERTAPTRGELYVPLGERRYHHNYNIRKVGKDYFVRVFGYDLIHYKHDADYIVINESRSYLDKSLLDVLTVVLGLVYGNEHNGKFTVYTGKVPSKTNSYRERHVFYRRSKFLLDMNEEGWYLPEPPTIYTYHLNRAEANNVRAVAKEFRTYMENIIKVRETVSVDMGLPNQGSSIAFTSYMFATTEIMHTLGENYSLWTRLINKPTTAESLTTLAHKNFYGVMLEGVEQTFTDWQLYEHRAKQFMEMIRSGDPEQFYKALLILVVCTGGTHAKLFNVRSEDSWFIGIPKLLDSLDQILLKANSRKCFSLIQVPQGQVPSDKYESYIFWPS